jgi:hypothetical protein
MTNPQKRDSLTDRYCSLMDQYAQFVAKAGKKVRRASPEESRALFEGFDSAHQERAIERLETEIAIFQETVEAGEALANPSRQVWRYLMKTRQVPCSDVFDKIRMTDTIQVYGSDHRLSFVSLNFYDYVSFTLDQIFAETWHSAVRRDAEIEQRLFEALIKAFSGESRQTVEVDVPRHLVEEVESESLLQSWLLVKYISPIYRDDYSIVVI